MNDNSRTIILPNGQPYRPTTNGDNLFQQNQVTLKRSSKGAIYWDIKVDGPNGRELLERVRKLDQAMIEYKEKVEA